MREKDAAILFVLIPTFVVLAVTGYLMQEVFYYSLPSLLLMGGGTYGTMFSLGKIFDWVWVKKHGGEVDV